MCVFAAILTLWKITLADIYFLVQYHLNILLNYKQNFEIDIFLCIKQYIML